MAFGYRVFGLFLRSNHSIPGLTPEDNEGHPVVDVFLGGRPEDWRLESFHHQWYASLYRTALGKPFLTIYTTGRPEPGYWFQYDDGVEIFIERSLDHIWVDWIDSSCLEHALIYLLGPVMAVLAQLRGAICLHGSAVALGQGMVVFLGPPGAGKSTTAAAFAQAGFSVAADDLVLLAENDGRYFVEPTYPLLRLWPESVEMLFGQYDAMPLLSPLWDKRGLSLNQRDYCFQRDALPLLGVYLLQDRTLADSAPFLVPVTGASALLGLISNSWAHYMNNTEFLISQLRVLTRLSETTPINRLVPHTDGGRLSDLCRLVQESLQ